MGEVETTRTCASWSFKKNLSYIKVSSLSKSCSVYFWPSLARTEFSSDFGIRSLRTEIRPASTTRWEPIVDVTLETNSR